MPLAWPLRLLPPLSASPPLRLGALWPTRAQPTSLDRHPDVRLWGCRGLVARNSHREMCSILGSDDDTGSIRQHGLPRGGQREEDSIVSSPQRCSNRGQAVPRDKSCQPTVGHRKGRGKMEMAMASRRQRPLLCSAVRGQSPISASSQAAGTTEESKRGNPCLAPEKARGEAPLSSRPAGPRRHGPRTRLDRRADELPARAAKPNLVATVSPFTPSRWRCKAEGVKSDDLNYARMEFAGSTSR
jgi:hypothetical protein